MKTARGRTVCWAATGLVAVLAASTIVQWPEIVSRYQLQRLRRDPGQLESLLESGSPGVRDCSRQKGGVHCPEAVVS